MVTNNNLNNIFFRVPTHLILMKCVYVLTKRCHWLIVILLEETAISHLQIVLMIKIYNTWELYFNL